MKELKWTQNILSIICFNQYYFSLNLYNKVYLVNSAIVYFRWRSLLILTAECCATNVSNDFLKLHVGPTSWCRSWYVHNIDMKHLRIRYLQQVLIQHLQHAEKCGKYQAVLALRQYIMNVFTIENNRHYHAKLLQ